MQSEELKKPEKTMKRVPEEKLIRGNNKEIWNWTQDRAIFILRIKDFINSSSELNKRKREWKKI